MKLAGSVGPQARALASGSTRAGEEAGGAYRTGIRQPESRMERRFAAVP
jgi:hypothetical protein